MLAHSLPGVFLKQWSFWERLLFWNSIKVFLFPCWLFGNLKGQQGDHRKALVLGKWMEEGWKDGFHEKGYRLRWGFVSGQDRVEVLGGRSQGEDKEELGCVTHLDRASGPGLRGGLCLP